MKNKYSFIISILSVGTLLLCSIVTFYFSYQRYTDFVFGKFDLGNMNQMLYNSSRLNFMILTDYFGSNNIRWSMSHIDPLILLLIPFNLIYSDASLLLFAQNVAFLLSAFLIYFISKTYKLSTLNSWLISFLIFIMPISGYILVWTTFHPSSLSLPFYFLIVYLLAIDKQKKLPKILKKYFSISLLVFTLLFIFGKEELGVVFAFSIPFLISQFKSQKKLLIQLGVIAFIWSCFCLFVLIPFYSGARNDSMTQFLKDSKISVDLDKFGNSNYFLYRYSEFGDSYSEIATSILLNPENFINILFNKHNVDTLIKLLLPNLFLVFTNPYLFIAFIPETLIQMLSADPEVFSITNHRLLVVLPFLILSVIKFVSKIDKKFKKSIYSTSFLFVIVSLNIFLCVDYKSPFVYPIIDKIQKKLVLRLVPAIASNGNNRIEFENDINKECANYLLSKLDTFDNVSVPQPFGALTSNRKYNALFPTGTKNANVIIADIYDRKIADFLDLSVDINKKIVKRSLKDDKFSLIYSCNRFFLFKKLPSQNDLGSFKVINDANFKKMDENKLAKNSYYYNSSIVVSGDKISFSYKYYLGEEESRNALFVYTILTNGSDTWQFVHIPSFYLNPIDDLPVGSLVEENFTLSKPEYLSKGTYSIYFGIGDKRENNNNLKVGNIDL